MKVVIQKEKPMVHSLKEFCENGSVDLMPSGAQINDNKRRAIGFGHEGETIERSPESILLETLGKRRAIGFGREGEVIDNGPSGKETAVGFGRSNEPAAQPSKPKTKIGFRQIAKARELTR